ncbi:MAG: hypothetical protein R2867_22825 [Caldilineaceae bacterium]
MELAFWRDLSVIWLSLFCFIGLVPPLAVLYLAVRGMNALHGKSYRWVRQAQGLSSHVPQQTKRAATKISEPVIQIQRRAKQVEAFFQSLHSTRL